MGHPDEFIRHQIKIAKEKARKLKSEHHELLWLPHKPEPVPESPYENMMRTFLTWQDAFPMDAIPDKDTVISWLTKFNGEDALQFLAKVNFIYNDLRTKGRTFDIAQLEHFFAPEVFKRLCAIASSRDSQAISKSNILYLQQLILLHSNRETGTLVRDNQIEFGKLLLAASEYCEGPSIFRELDSMEEKVRSFAGFSFRNLPFNRNEWIGGLFSRYWYFAKNLKWDLGQGIIKSAMFDLAVKFGILAHYVKDNPGAVLRDPEKFLIGDDYFQHLHESIREQAKEVLNSASLDWNGHNAAMRKSEIGLCGYNTRPFFEKPLYKFPSMSHFALDSHILAKHACTHFKFKLIEASRKAGGRAAVAITMGEWGRIFESYSMKVISSALAKVPGPKTVFIDGENGYRGADMILLQNNTATIIEITSSGVPINKQLSGDWTQIEKSIDWILFKTQDGSKGKMQQIIDAVVKLKGGGFVVDGVPVKDIRGIFPVIVFEEGISQVRPIISIIREKAVKAGLDSEVASRLELWDSEELESSEAAFAYGIAAAVAKKHASEYRDLPWRNFLKREGMSSKSSFVDASFDVATADLSRLLFKGEMPSK